MASEVPDLLSGDPADFQDPAYREAVIDLLGAISYGEISAFERLAEDSKMAPAIRDKMALATMAAAELGHVARLHERLTELGADPYDAMAPFIAPIEKFHRHTALIHAGGSRDVAAREPALNDDGAVDIRASQQR